MLKYLFIPKVNPSLFVSLNLSLFLELYFRHDSAYSNFSKITGSLDTNSLSRNKMAQSPLEVLGKQIQPSPRNGHT